MIGVKPVAANSAEGYYNGFCTRFPTARERRLAALTLLPDNPEDQDWQLFTRTVLAAQWADNLVDSKRTAKLLYDLTPTLQQNAGKRAVELRGGITFSDLTAFGRGESLPGYGFGLSVGRIEKGAAPRYTFGKTPPMLRPSGVPGDAKFLDFKVRIPITLQQQLDVDAEGRVAVEVLETPVPTEFIAYMGTVSLEDNPELYHNTKFTTEGEIAFGDTATTAALEAVAALSLRSEPALA